MKIDFNAAITGFDGNSIKKEKSEEALTLGYFSVIVLSANEPELSVEDKFNRGALAQEIYKSKVDVSVEDVVLLKDLIGKAYGPLVTFKCHEILDPKS